MAAPRPRELPVTNATRPCATGIWRSLHHAQRIGCAGRTTWPAAWPEGQWPPDCALTTTERAGGVLDARRRQEVRAACCPARGRPGTASYQDPHLAAPYP